MARSRVLCDIKPECSELKISVSISGSFPSSFSAIEEVDHGKFLYMDAYPRVEITGFLLKKEIG